MEKEYRVSFCHPLKEDIQEMDGIGKEQVMETFESIAWNDFLEQMNTANDNDIYYSPSLEIEHKELKSGLCVSAIDGTEWYIFFKRPKVVKKTKWFKKVEVLDQNYTSDVQRQSLADVKECLEALSNGNWGFLEEKIP